MNKPEKGAIKWFNVTKGYGFISCSGGSEIFLHITDVENGGKTELKPGARVEFSRGEDARSRLKAINVRFLTS